jgi:hypothetical protein
MKNMKGMKGMKKSKSSNNGLGGLRRIRTDRHCPHSNRRSSLFEFEKWGLALARNDPF